jgi:tellurite methyltransferase
MPPNPLLKDYSFLFIEPRLEGPVLDLACGRGKNGLFLAERGLPVVLADRSAEALKEAEKSAEGKNLDVRFWEIDLETGGNPLKENYYRGILVFRYLHRPLIPFIRKGIIEGGILVYETFTLEQIRYGAPHNPDHLLKPGELLGWFKDWEVIHSFEGLLDNPKRAVAQIVCEKPH